jgi:hypothetical protein
MANKFATINATVMWAFLNRRNDMSNKYQVDLCNLSADDATALGELGIDVKQNPNKPDKGRFITCKSEYEIVPLDKDGNTIDAIIGNGTRAKAVIGTYRWTFKNRSGVSPSLAKLVITDLKEYSPTKEEEAEAL